jgi:type I restriction enzyme S subunit
MIGSDLSRVGETCVVGDGTHSKIPRQDSGVLYLTCRNFKDGRTDLSKVYYISETDYAKHFLGGGKALATPEPGDLVFSIIGTIGEPYLVRESDRWGISSSVAIVRPDRTVLDPQFLLYWFKGPVFQAALRGVSGGVAQGYVSLEMIRSLPVRVPLLPEQRRIAGILSAYDDLIENCERRIRVLDEMARTLYREWFVLFRYPGYENTQLVDSPLGRIPKGWTVAPLSSLTTKIGSGATPRGGKEAYRSEGVALIRSLNIYDDRFEFDDLAFIDDEQARQLDNVIVEPFDVLLNITGASVARCAMVPSYVLPARVNQHVAIVRADRLRIDPHLLLDAINSNARKAHLLALAQGGATREALTKETISKFEIVVPPKELVGRYGDLAATSSVEREGLRRRAENLRKTRDLLLPRLLSGQLSVEDAA